MAACAAIVAAVTAAPAGAQTCIERLTPGSAEALLPESSSARTLTQVAEAIFCHPNFLEQAPAFYRDLVIRLDDVPRRFDGAGTSESAKDARDSHCQSRPPVALDDVVAMDVVRRAASNESFTRYLSCDRARFEFGGSLRVLVKERGQGDSMSLSAVDQADSEESTTFLASRTLKCQGALVEKDLSLGSKPKGAICIREGSDEVFIVLVSSRGRVDVTLGRRGRAGLCEIVRISEKETWRDTGTCREETVLTPQLHNEPERPFDIVVRAGNNERIGDECVALYCRPRPGFSNGCAFGRKVGQRISSDEAVTRLMVGSHPQMWTRGFKIQERDVTLEETPVKKFDVLFGVPFTVEVPDGGTTRLSCDIMGTPVALDPLQPQPEVAQILRQLGDTVKSGNSKLLTFEVPAP